MKRGSAHRDQRREEAEVRQAERQKRTPQEQLSLLDTKLGPGVGASKERARLQKIIEDQSAAKAKRTSSKEKPKTRAGRRAEKNKRKNK